MNTKKVMRKHGYAAQAGAPKSRLKTLVTFQTSSQCYLWTTDRGRSRLIKH